MSAGTAVLLILGTGTYLFKAAGPVLLGDRPLPPRIQYLVDLLPAALLAALAAVSTFTAGGAWQLDARALGLLAAGVALWRRAPFVVVVVLASAITAAARAAGLN